MCDVAAFVDIAGNMVAINGQLAKRNMSWAKENFNADDRIHAGLRSFILPCSRMSVDRSISHEPRA